MQSTRSTSVGQRPSPLRSPICRRSVRGFNRPGSISERNANATDSESAKELPLMLRALRGETVERPPVWMMRQAGRYMKAYQDLCTKYPTFRERSEKVDIAVEITLQPWKAFRPDGVVLFSDILTPLPGMNIPFDIVRGKGPVIYHPIRTMEDVETVKKLNPDRSCSFVGEALRRLRTELNNEATLLGFVGAPYTLASYIVEGASSKRYKHLKLLAFNEPDTLHALLNVLADSIILYSRYQADAGAQVIQIFDSWASTLSPRDFDVFAGPYIKRIITELKKTHPDIAVILYINGSGGLVERMAECKPDIISVDHSIDMIDAIKRINDDSIAVQGNLDPALLLGSKDRIEHEIVELVRRVKETGARHVLNLGHGVLPGTSEESVAHYFQVARTVHERL